MASTLTRTRHATPTSPSMLSLTRRIPREQVTIGVAVAAVAEAAKEVATEGVTTAEEAGTATTAGTIVVITTMAGMKSVEPEARAEIKDNLETMKKITR